MTEFATIIGSHKETGIQSEVRLPSFASLCSSIIRMDSCNRCQCESHHTHHRDHNHKNNDPLNWERLCTLCHAKEHGIEPRLSELRKLVAYYQKVQKTKLAVGQTLKSLGRIELDAPPELLEQEKQLKLLERHYEKGVIKYWQGNSESRHHWAIQIFGVGDISISKILSEIDWDKTPSVPALWAYAGFAPEQVKGKGKKANWNQRLKAYCYQLVDCFIKQRTPKYRELYDVEKQKQMDNGIKRGHAHNRAIRKVAKVFLRDLYLVGVGKDQS